MSMWRLVLAGAVGVSVLGCRPASGPSERTPPGVRPPAAGRAPDAGGFVLLFQDDDRLMRLTSDGASLEEARGVGEQVVAAATAPVVAYRDDQGGIHRHELGRPQAGEPALGAGGEWALAVSPDGRRVAYDAKEGFWASLPDGTVAGFDPPPCVSGLGWSPDGERLAVGAMGVDDREAEDGGLWLWESGETARELVEPITGWGCSRDVRWSPDGKWIAWSRGAGDGWTGDLVRADSTDLRRDALGAGPLEWAADSSGVLVTVHIEAGAFRTGYYDVAAKKLTPFGEETTEAVACLSPDGKRALVLERTGGAIIDLTTMAEKPWGVAMAATAVAWSKDDRIAVVVREDGRQLVRVYALAGELRHECAAKGMVYPRLAWVRDGGWGGSSHG